LRKLLFVAVLMVMGIVSRGAADIWENSYSTVVATYQNGVKITTGNISVDLIDVMSAGSADSVISIYDTALSTLTPGIKKYEGWQGSSARVIPVGLDLSTGMYISNLGTTPAIVRFKIRQKSRY